MKPLPIVVLISGTGSNLQAIIEAQHKNLPVDIRAVITDNPHAKGLLFAKNAGIEQVIIDPKDFANTNLFNQQLQQTISGYQPQLICLAGFMRILSAELVNHFLGKMINIHPSLLPAYKGLNTHARALEAGETCHGSTIHFVTAELDSGPIIAQINTTIRMDDSVNILNKRVKRLEHLLYPCVLNWFATKRIEWKNGKIFFDGKMHHSYIFSEEELKAIFF